MKKFLIAVLNNGLAGRSTWGYSVFVDRGSRKCSTILWSREFDFQFCSSDKLNKLQWQILFREKLLLECKQSGKTFSYLRIKQIISCSSWSVKVKEHKMSCDSDHWQQRWKDPNSSSRQIYEYNKFGWIRNCKFVLNGWTGTAWNNYLVNYLWSLNSIYFPSCLC